MCVAETFDACNLQVKFCLAEGEFRWTSEYLVTRN